MHFHLILKLNLHLIYSTTLAKVFIDVILLHPSWRTVRAN